MQLYESLKSMTTVADVDTMMMLVASSEPQIHATVNCIVTKFCDETNTNKSNFCDITTLNGYEYINLRLADLPIELLRMLYKLVWLHRQSVDIEKTRLQINE